MVRGTLILLACLLAVPALAKSRDEPPGEEIPYRSNFEASGQEYGARCGAVPSAEAKGYFGPKMTNAPAAKPGGRQGRNGPAKAEAKPGNLSSRN